MFGNKNIENNETCGTTIGGKLLFFVLGGGIGAAIALLFAPKSGRELRQDIAEAAEKGYDETLDAANRVKEQAVEYFETAREKGGEVLETIAEKASAVKTEIKEDAAKMGDAVEGAARRVADTVRAKRVF